MRVQRHMLLCGLVLSVGCLHSPPGSKVFTDEWATDVIRPGEKRSGGEWLLLDKQGAPRTAIRVDKDGKPNLAFGNKSGLRTEVGVHHGAPRAKISYGWEW